MTTLKPKSETSDNPERNNGRRSFIWKAGAAVSAVAASAVTGFSRPEGDRPDILEDANAVRTLHRTYEARLHEGRYEEVLELFADKAEVAYNGGLFMGKKGIRRLFCNRFSSGLTGRKMEPAPGFAVETVDTVEIAEDGKSADGRFPYSIQAGQPMDEESSLVAMARLHGEGIRKWWEGGVQHVHYVKEGKEWKIRRLEYRVASQADYKPGRSYARPIEEPAFTKIYPADPNGPDRI
jgi:carotenoid cleavage dioxygenase